MIVLQILKSKEMKKIAFMFAAAAMMVACGNTQTKPAAEEVEAPVEEVAEVVEEYVLTAEDSIAAKAAVAELGIAEEAENYAAAVDSVLNDIKAKAQSLKDGAEAAVDAAADAVEAAGDAIDAAKEAIQ